MTSIVSKKINGNKYLYLVESIRNGKKVTQKTIKYIGKKRPISKAEFECMQISHKREDWILNETKDCLSYKDHQKMKDCSDSYKKYRKELDNMSKEKEREKFLSKFIANSNSIEGSTLSEKDTFNYLFNDISPKGNNKKELFMATNLLNAWKYVEKNSKRFPTEEDIKNIHKLVNKEIEEDRTLGNYKKMQNYVGDIYTTSYLFVDERMKELLKWIKTSHKKVDYFEVAFQSHAQFELIHPFIDGNGRVGRLLINWLLMYKGLSPLAIKNANRSDYLSALYNAQKGNLVSICRFCFKEYTKQHDFVVVNS